MDCSLLLMVEKKWTELSGGLPTISFRDIKIQRRENDLVVGSFGRGIYILDDYTPLRSVSEKGFAQEALLFTPRTADWYLEDALHTDSAGDFEYRAENPEFGATFTYYLRDGLKSAKDKREDAEKAAEEKGKYPRYPAWEVIEKELREAEPKAFLLIKDSQGKTVRKLDVESKKGLHRATWDLRFASRNALGTQPSFFGDEGPLVAPGTYTAALFATEKGKSRKLTDAVSFKVEPIYQETVEGGVSPAERTQQILLVENLRARVSAASAQVSDLETQLKSFRMALDRSSAAGTEMEQVLEKLRQDVFAANELIGGKTSSRDKGAVPANIGSRLFMIEFARATTWGLTDTQKQQMKYVEATLARLEPKLKMLMTNEFPAFRDSLSAAGAPWVPDGLVEEESDEAVERY